MSLLIRSLRGRLRTPGTRRLSNPGDVDGRRRADHPSDDRTAPDPSAASRPPVDFPVGAQPRAARLHYLLD